MIGNVKDLEAKVIDSPLVKEASMKVLIGAAEGWEDHVMRQMEVGIGGFTPKHSHDWPHINYMVAGEGELMIEGVVTKVTAGSYAYVPANKLHQFKNTGKVAFKFLCIVPELGHTY